MAPPFNLYPSSLAVAAKAKKRKIFSEDEALSLIAACEETLESVEETQAEAEELCTRAGLATASNLPKLLRQKPSDSSVASTSTAGYSNTDHLVAWTGDYQLDWITKLKRELVARSRFQQPEKKGDERWDKPRMPGERRRRIVRSKDLPGAPPEPPPSGYIVFVGQMTTKWRHDHPHDRHNQTRVIQEVSKIWRISLSDADRKYYNDFSDQARREYKKLQMEYRATGLCTPSPNFEKIEGTGLWVRKKMEEKNRLEREIAGYDTVVFPMRPPEFDEEYRKREKESLERRKLKLKREYEEKRKKKEELLKNEAARKEEMKAKSAEEGEPVPVEKEGEPVPVEKGEEGEHATFDASDEDLVS